MASLQENVQTIKDSVARMKVAAELPVTATLEELTTKVEEGGSSGGGSSNVENGLLKQYKANIESISANTFIDFVTSYKFKSYSELVGTAAYSRIFNIDRFRNNKIIGVFGSKIAIYNYEDDTLVEEFISTNLLTASSSDTNFHIIQPITDNLILFINGSSGYSGTGYLVEISDNNVCSIVATISSIATNIIKTHCVIKNNIAYIHLLGYIDASRAYAGIKCLEINLNDYTYSLGTQFTVREVGYNSTYQGLAEIINDNTFIYNVIYSNSLYITKVTFDYDTSTYTKKSYSSLSGFTDYSCINWYDEQRGFIIYNTYENSVYKLNWAYIDLGTGTTVSLPSGGIIDEQTTTWSYLTPYKVNNSCFILTCNSPTNKNFTSCRVFRGNIDTKELSYGMEFVFEVDTSITTKPKYYNVEFERQACAIMNDTSFAFTVASYMGLMKIDGFDIIQTNGDEMRVKVSTGIIKGITKTECTSEITGDVWVLI